MVYLDTNIFLRYLTQPDPKQSHLIQQAGQAKTIFEQINARKLQATTSEGVIAEVVWVTSSKKLYNVPRPKIAQLLTPLLRLPTLKLPHKRTCMRALELYVYHPFLDFVDALNIAHMERQKIPTILSFDEDFDKIPGIKRTI